MNEDELLRQLKHNLVQFAEDYRRIFKAYEDDNESHLSWSYEIAISLARISGQDVMTNLGMLKYLWDKKAKEHDEKIRQELRERKRQKRKENSNERDE